MQHNDRFWSVTNDKGWGVTTDANAAFIAVRRAKLLFDGPYKVREVTTARQTAQAAVRARGMRTDEATVILPYGARHIDQGNGHTRCGLSIGDGAAHDAPTADQRISCRFCHTNTTYPRRSR